MRSTGWLSAKVQGWKPGLMLAGFLTSLEGEELSGHDRVLALAAYQKMASYFQAKMLGEMAAICDQMGTDGDNPEEAVEAAAAEIRVALRLTRRAADSDLGLALELTQRLPRVWQALAAGEIDLRRVRVIVAGTAHLPEETARLVVEQFIERAAWLTTGQLHALLRRVCLETDPDQAADRYQQAVSERRVVMEPSVEGTAHLSGFDLAPDRAAAAMRRITDLAQTLKTGTESRTLDQLRADVFLDLLEGNIQQRRYGRGTVDIHVDLETLTRLADHPGELAGYGPIVADLARQVAEQQAGAEWRFTVTHPDSGQVISNGITRRRPNTGQRRHVQSRNRTCIFPGCRMPATDCDLDHTTPWAEGGTTTIDNLVPLCRYDHQIRHRTGWTHQPLPNGDHQWISRLGHTYTTSGRSP